MEVDRCFDAVVVGAGPVGLFAASELGMLGVRTAVLDSQDEVGGQCSALYPEKPVYGVPALERVTATDLIKSLHSQALSLGATVFADTCVNDIMRTGQDQDQGQGQGQAQANQDSAVFEIKTSNGAFFARTVVIAAGVGTFTHNRIGLPNEAEFEGQSLFYKVLDVNKFSNSRVVIAGGGNAAIDWGVELCKIAESVSVVHRRDSFRCSDASLGRLKVFENKGIARIYAPFEITALGRQEGKCGKIARITVKNDKQEEVIPADFLLVFFGVSANVSYMQGWGLEMHNQKIIINEADGATNQAGIFAAGDVVHYAEKMKIIVSGFGEAAKSAYAVKRFLGAHPAPPNWPIARAPVTAPVSACTAETR
ncbi:MAG: NAD(P)/FAD-dependent oxidoreductase [Holosporales bacterium]|jgi:thioredoxin reductase (NADPH)|nr:NAD(P)/FAD-dependent oxidoreductase [Holosporales bacterium]